MANLILEVSVVKGPWNIWGSEWAITWLKSQSQKATEPEFHLLVPQKPLLLYPAYQSVAVGSLGSVLLKVCSANWSLWPNVQPLMWWTPQLTLSLVNTAHIFLLRALQGCFTHDQPRIQGLLAFPRLIKMSEAWETLGSSEILKWNCKKILLMKCLIM